MVTILHMLLRCSICLCRQTSSVVFDPYRSCPFIMRRAVHVGDCLQQTAYSSSSTVITVVTVVSAVFIINTTTFCTFSLIFIILSMPYFICTLSSFHITATVSWVSDLILLQAVSQHQAQSVAVSALYFTTVSEQRLSRTLKKILLIYWPTRCSTDILAGRNSTGLSQGAYILWVYRAGTYRLEYPLIFLCHFSDESDHKGKYCQVSMTAI